MNEVAPEGPELPTVMERLRVTVVAGVVLGVLIGGIGGRLAMLLLRATSSDSVRGVISDDGFEIGRVTLGGTYGLLAVCAAIGVIGSAAYSLVATSLLGPSWFRSTTCALGAGAVVGSMLVHADGVDFTLLEPTWLAIALFVALPALFGMTIGMTRRALERSDGWLNSGRRRWWIPVVVVASFPVSLFPSAFVACGVLVSHSARTANGYGFLDPGNRRIRWSARAGWFVIACLGFITLVNDVHALT